jgi:hypothetical protein
MQNPVADSFLAYLESIRLPDDLPDDGDEAARVLKAVQERALRNPHLDASDQVDEMVATSPQPAWTLLCDVVERCDQADLSMLGAGVLQTFTQMHAPAFADAIESQIRSSERFFRAFQYVAMTGVPLSVQQRINAALLERGADPKLVVEYDEGEDGDA